MTVTAFTQVEDVMKIGTGNPHKIDQPSHPSRLIHHTVTITDTGRSVQMCNNILIYQADQIMLANAIGIEPRNCRQHAILCGQIESTLQIATLLEKVIQQGTDPKTANPRPFRQGREQTGSFIFRQFRPCRILPASMECPPQSEFPGRHRSRRLLLVDVRPQQPRQLQRRNRHMPISAVVPPRAHRRFPIPSQLFYTRRT